MLSSGAPRQAKSLPSQARDRPLRLLMWQFTHVASTLTGALVSSPTGVTAIAALSTSNGSAVSEVCVFTMASTAAVSRSFVIDGGGGGGGMVVGGAPRWSPPQLASKPQLTIAPPIKKANFAFMELDLRSSVSRGSAYSSTGRPSGSSPDWPARRQ